MLKDSQYWLLLLCTAIGLTGGWCIGFHDGELAERAAQIFQVVSL